MAPDDDLCSRPAAALAASIRARDVSAREVVDAHLARIERVNPALNAVVALSADQARGEADAADAALARGDAVGPLHGVPVTVKDCFGVAGTTATVGTKGLASFVAPRDDEAVARLRAAGAIVLGKTNCPELMLAFETDNLVYGRTNNPYDLERTPGGSSGGEAAIVAAAGSPLGLGSDSFGSVRVPAHFCGVAGIKPSHGRVPSTSAVLPTVGHIARLRSVGLLARSVDGLALALPLLCGPDGRDPWAAPVPLGDPAQVDVGSLRVAVHTDNGVAPPTPETAAAVRAAADALAGLGMPVVEARPPMVEQAGNALSLLEADGGAGPRRVLGMVGTTEVSPLLQAVLDRMQANARTTAELGGLLAWWDVFRAAMLGFMAEHDVIVCPVSAAPAPPHGTSLDGIDGFSYAWTFNVTGWPVVTLRAGTSPEGLPIGVQVVAPPWRDDVALAVAARLEPALIGWQAPPL